MAKIAIDAREWSTSTGRYISNLVRQLELIDTTNQYVILLKPRDLDAWTPQNPMFTKQACPYPEFSFAEQIAYKRALANLDADLVHFGMVQQPAWYRGRTVTTINDLTTTRFSNPSKNRLVYWLKQRVYMWLNRRVARRATALLTYSQYVKDDIAQFAGIDAGKITVTPLAAEPIGAAAEPVAGLEHQQFLLYIGRPMPHKNLERLIDAFRLLKAQHPHLKLALVGKRDANYQRLERLVRHWGVDNMVFTDFVSEGGLRWLYEHCAAYVFPSLSEGFGLPGLEAMAHGAPLVSSNATCLPEVYGEAAHYFDPLDTQAMADAINEVLTNQALRQQLIARGHSQLQKYSWQRTAEQTLAVYQQALR